MPALFSPELPEGPRLILIRFGSVSGIPPANDLYENRFHLLSYPAEVPFRLTEATFEPDEPLIRPSAIGQTAWWSVKAASYGSIRISLNTSNPSPVLSVFVAGTNGPGERIASSMTRRGTSQGFLSARPFVDFDVTPGADYAIQMDRFASSLASGVMQVVFLPAPANDTPESAQRISGNQIIMTLTNEAATLRSGEPVMPNLSGSNSVWFVWTAEAAGIVQMGDAYLVRHQEPQWFGGGFGTSNCTIGGIGGPDWEDVEAPPPFAPVFGVYQSWLPNAAPGPSPLPLHVFQEDGHNWDNDDCESPLVGEWKTRWGVPLTTKRLIFDVHQGEEFLFALDDKFNSHGTTPFNLLWLPRPANDAWADRIRLPSESGTAVGRTFGATSEAGESALLGATNELLRTVWWEWRAPHSGRWAAPLFEGNRWTPGSGITVFRGSTPSAAGRITDTPLGIPCFDASAGEVFQIVVSAAGFQGESIRFGLRNGGAPKLVVETVTDSGGT